MKALIALALVFAVSTSHAYGLSCGQLVDYKNNLAKELNWLREKMRETRNSDTLELYMGQYEELYAKYQNAEKAISSDCK
ncbi:hypothetical protein AZI87_08085 [Bdellovibrio bacteriovorus]|uniref:Uncharacterized protein n=1 Tax=Bdellovibrio bacteriovorus TaxID=959 RepID=A0A161PFC1_BDEBC|nr:hypothetical protein [Bdellovibrio bacteriovorus]KYG69164.1 hypothetical protein AZI87_08085 [Bdellovibrio bacteriovorus]